MIQYEKFGTLKKKILDMILHSSTSPSSETYTLTSLTRCLWEAAYASTWMDSLPHNHLPHFLHLAFLHSSPVSLRMADSYVSNLVTKNSFGSSSRRIIIN